MIKAIIFDLDGVLCQTEDYRLEKEYEYLESLGVRVSKQDLYTSAGGTKVDKGINFDRLFGEQEAYIRNRKSILNKMHTATDFLDIRTDNIIEVLEFLHEKKIRIACASNSTYARLEIIMNDCMIRNYFDLVLSTELTDKRKPDPYIYNETVRLLNIQKDECIVVEDSKMGIEAAKAAELFTVAYKDKGGFIDQSKADQIITDMREIYTFL